MAAVRMVCRSSVKLFEHASQKILIIPAAGVQNWKPVNKIESEWPPFDEPRKLRLPIIEKQPLERSTGLPKHMPKGHKEMRGPEEVHDKLMHRQYGIQALDGGRMRFGHFEMLRNSLNRKLDQKRMFVVYRIPAVWQPIYRKGVGVTQGMGKPKPKTYVTPVKANRIILELGGNVEFFEVEVILARLAAKLPFKARVVSQEILEREERELKELEESNLNKFTFKYCLDNNFFGCRLWASPYDYKWVGKYE